MIYILGGILFLIVALVAAFFLSPRPMAKLVYKLFDGGMAVEPENYKEIEKNTYMYKDIPYNSEYELGTLDIIIKKDLEKKMPVVFWVHGGGYVGGDKSDITEYGVQIANEGFIFININYGLAPSSNYPTPLLQLAEAYQYIFINKDRYNINMDKCYFGGDSAGAQIVGQFINTQVDRDYGMKVGVDKVIDPDKIKGSILFCGPYDLEAFKKIENNAVRYFINNIGWAYMGKRKWMDMDSTRELSLINHISENFPPTFITDGNFLTFEEQGLELSKKLKRKGVLVHDVFYPHNNELVHNYQFMMDLKESRNTFNELREFLNITKNI